MIIEAILEHLRRREWSVSHYGVCRLVANGSQMEMYRAVYGPARIRLTLDESTLRVFTLGNPEIGKLLHDTHKFDLSDPTSLDQLDHLLETLEGVLQCH